MDEKRIYLLAQFDERTNKKLAGIYDKLFQEGIVGEQTKDIPYHITMGNFDLSCETEVIERAQIVCRQTKPFDIALNYIGLFGLNVLSDHTPPSERIARESARINAASLKKSLLTYNL